MQGRTYQTFVDTAEPYGIDLGNVCSFGLQQLFKGDAVLRSLACSNTHAIGFERLADGSVAQDVVWICRLWLLVSYQCPIISGQIDVNGKAGRYLPSMKTGLNSTRCFIYSIASGTLQTW